MSASFAGSRYLDERRRRRLAADAGDGERVPQPTSVSASPSPVMKLRSPSRSSTTRLPLRKLISPKLWKLWSFGGVALAIAVGILVAGVMAETDGKVVGPGFVRLFGLTGGPAVTWYCGLLLLLSGQLAWLIWWARSRSLRDFAGRYRIWSWTAAAGFAFAGLVATGAHRAWSETMGWLWPLDFWNKDVLCWLVPAAIIVAWLVRSLSQEMRDCRSSLWLLRLSGAGWVSACLPMLGPGFAPGNAHSRLLHAGAVLFASVCLFESFLLHCRHVIYVTAEPPDPPAKNPRRFVTIFLRQCAARLSRLHLPRTPRTFPFTRKSIPPAPSRERNNDPPPQGASRGTHRPPPEKESIPQQSASLNQAPREESGTEHRADQSTRDSGSTSAKSAVVQVDEPHDSATKEPDKELLKGLSKRDRRKLRKQWRDQQQASRQR